MGVTESHMGRGSVSRCTTLLAVTLLTAYCDNGWHGYERPLEAAHRAQFLPIAQGCLLSEGSLHGHQFVQCILKQLDAFSEPVSAVLDHDSEEDDQYEQYSAHHQTDTVVDLIRNFTCSRASESSPPVEELVWTTTHQKHHGGCMPEDLWSLLQGELIGEDIGAPIQMSVEDAKMRCADLRGCEGFSEETLAGGAGHDAELFAAFEAASGVAAVVEHKPTFVHFKRDALQSARETIPPTPGWVSWLKVHSDELSQCNGVHTPLPSKVDYQVRILQREPLVAVIPSFTTDAECRAMVEAGGPQSAMKRAFEDEGQTSLRRAYSSNIHTDWRNSTAVVTRVMRRTLAAVRNLTGFVLMGGGQEPLNAVLYTDVGDEYRPHCDGLCEGSEYPFGERVATSILYCQTPTGGGHTSFTRAGLMVKPEANSLLVFSYKFDNGTMDGGQSEHSSCPVLGGRKWVGNQWFREGVDAENPWSDVITGFTATQRVRTEMGEGDYVPHDHGYDQDDEFYVDGDEIEDDL